jgi:hypothetical protein
LIICDDLIFRFWKTKLLSLLTSIHLHLGSKSTGVFDTLLFDADNVRKTRIAKMFKRALVSMLETTKIIYCQSYNSPCRNEEIFNWFKKGITRENLNILRVIKKFYFLEVLAFFLLIERQYKYVRNENGLNLAHSLIAFSEVFLVRCISLFIVGNGACIMNTLPSHYHDKRINVSRCSKRTFVPTWLLNKCFTI